MSSNGTFYLTCAIFSTVLMLQLTDFWWKGRKDPGVAFWVAGGWMFVGTDFVFIFRSHMPTQVGRIIPTILVTASYGTLFWACRKVAGHGFRWRLLWITVAVHACILFGMDQFGVFNNGRVILDRFIWAAFCLGGAYSLHQSSRLYWKSLNSPATILAIQGVFFIIRALTSVLMVTLKWQTIDTILGVFGNVDVMLFNASFFISVLIALLRGRTEDLATATVENDTLSGLLPVCAWCKNVRDDDGYWKEITEYVSKKSSLKMTHGICQDCENKMNASLERTTPR